MRCGYPERLAQQALGHNGRAVQHAYLKHAEFTVPSLDDWEKQWKEHPRKVVKPAVVPVDFQGQQAGPWRTATDAPATAVAQIG